MIRRSATRSILLIVVHHAISDGWSTGLLLRTFWNKLQRALQGSAEPDRPQPANIPQQLDAAYWEADDIENNHWKTQLAYWNTQLARPLPRLAPPTKLRARAYNQRFTIRAPDIDKLRAVAKEHKTSLNVLFTALYAQVLGRINGLTLAGELLVRLPVAARRSETEPIIGCFADAMVLRIPCASSSLTDALSQTHETFYEACVQPHSYSGRN